MSDSWNPHDYHDTFREDIMALVEKKVKEGHTEEVSEVEEGKPGKSSAEILDLSELLKRSLKKGKPAAKRGAKAAASESDDAADAEEPAAAAKPARKTATRRKRA
jgi:DNA end-binding protein Ku